MTEPTTPSDPPHCHRHPRRVSYVRCQRCDQPACPECQRPAAVGVHCVDCVAAAASQQRYARTAAGADASSLGAKPVVTYAILASCIALYLVQLTVREFTSAMSFVPALAAQEPWRIVTSGFLHSPGQIWHIAFNMYVLYAVGGTVEQVMGRWRYIGTYVASLIMGSAFFAVIAGPYETYQGSAYLTQAVGASGAIFGLFGALLVLQRASGGPSRSLAVLVAINFGIGFVLPRVAWEAHVGGFVAGVVIAAVMAGTMRSRKPAIWAAVAIAVTGVVGVIGALWPALVAPAILT